MVPLINWSWLDQLLVHWNIRTQTRLRRAKVYRILFGWWCTVDWPPCLFDLVVWADEACGTAACCNALYLAQEEDRCAYGQSLQRQLHWHADSATPGLPSRRLPTLPGAGSCVNHMARVMKHRHEFSYPSSPAGSVWSWWMGYCDGTLFSSWVESRELDSSWGFLLALKTEILAAPTTSPVSSVQGILLTQSALSKSVLPAQSCERILE